MTSFRKPRGGPRAANMIRFEDPADPAVELREEQMGYAAASRRSEPPRAFTREQEASDLIAEYGRSEAHLIVARQLAKARDRQDDPQSIWLAEMLERIDAAIK
jgi:hypothetical protein